MGTNPLSAASFPPFARLPLVAFADSTKTVEEGVGVVMLPMASEGGAFTGTVQVEAVPPSNAVAGTDYTIPATVSMTNGVANLPLTLLDNLTLSQTFRILVLQVKSPASSPQYTPGGGFRTTVVIGDNDAYWNGALDTGEAGLIQNFRLRMLKQGSTSQISFVAGTTNDGLPTSAAMGTTDQSEGMVPIGVWSATVATNTATAFDITSAGMPVGAQATLFGSGLSLSRVLRLQAGGAVPQTSVSPIIIHGTFLETISSPGNNAPHLTTTRTGRVSLSREVSAIPTL